MTAGSVTFTPGFSTIAGRRALRLGDHRHYAAHNGLWRRRTVGTSRTNLGKRFPALVAVDDLVSFQVATRSAASLGSNGVTTMKMLTWLPVAPTPRASQKLDIRNRTLPDSSGDHSRRVRLLRGMTVAGASSFIAEIRNAAVVPA